MAASKTLSMEPEVIETDPWKIMKDVQIPRGSSDEKSVPFSLNNYSTQIPCGKKVSVPYPVALRVEMYLRALERETDVRESIPNNL